MRLDERQHELHRDRGVDGAAAGAQDRAPGFRGVRVRRYDELRARAHGRAGCACDGAERERGHAATAEDAAQPQQTATRASALPELLFQPLGDDGDERTR